MPGPIVRQCLTLLTTQHELQWFWRASRVLHKAASDDRRDEAVAERAAIKGGLSDLSIAQYRAHILDRLAAQLFARRVQCKALALLSEAANDGGGEAPSAA